MSYTVTAKLIKVLPMQTGEGKNGTWKKQEIVLETDGQYPQKLCMSAWGDKIQEDKFVEGNMLKIDFDINSREYNGRWYTELKVWKTELPNSNNFVSDNVPNQANNFELNETDNFSDDLPF